MKLKQKKLSFCLLIVTIISISLGFKFKDDIVATAKEYRSMTHIYESLGFNLPSLIEKNQHFKLTNLTGKRFLLSFFTDHCKKCENNFKYFSELSELSIPVYGIFCENKNKLLTNDFASMRNIYRDIALDTRGAVSDKWLLVGAPETFLIDEKGMIVKRIKGAITQNTYETEILPFFNE